MVVRPIITYAATIWWPKLKYKTIQAKLSKLQRLTCLGIAGAPTATVVLLGLLLLHLNIEAEAEVGIHRHSCNE
jgi:hypothetical protein